MKVLKHLKVIGLSIVFIGIVTGLGNLLGWFTHTERLEMVELIRTKGSIPVTTAGFRELVRAYPPRSPVKTIVIIRLGPTTAISSGGYVTPTGPLAYYDVNNHRTLPALTFNELEQWSTASYYPWLAWVVSAIGFVTTVVGVANDLRRRKQ